MTTYTIIGGVNGVGKSSFTGVIKERSTDLGIIVDKELLERINQAIGHIKLVDLRPQHLNSFYKNLTEPGVRLGTGRTTGKIDLAAWLKENKKSRAGIAEAAGVATTNGSTAARGKAIARSRSPGQWRKSWGMYSR